MHLQMAEALLRDPEQLLLDVLDRALVAEVAADGEDRDARLRTAEQPPEGEPGSACRDVPQRDLHE